MNRQFALICLLLAVAPAALGADRPACPGARPGVKRVFFGDLHVHTSFSIDAYAIGTRVDPADAYAFAKGQALTLSDGRTRTRLERPLDFAAVTDHAEYFDVSYLCGDPTHSDRDWCRRFREASQPDPQIQGFRKFALPLFAGPKSLPAPLCEASGECRQARTSQWARARAMANDANEPCRFTAFVANEWSATPDARHWHRNLIYGSDRVPDYPINAIDQPDVQSMWTALDRQCRAEDGCDVVAIPHNMNLAEGGGFDVESEDELSLRLRARFERLAEVYQHKGASECLSDWNRRGEDDCSFELMFPARFGGPFGGKVDEATWNRMRSTYYRSLLARGLQMQQRLRFNPLQLGAVASTDTHDGTPGAVEEDAWLGHFGADLSPSVRFSLFPDASPGGLVGVWAEENTRASLFAALKRREVFGTSGPRIVVRFFALPADVADPCRRGDLPAGAVPMGGTLPAGARYRPMFVVQALMDREPLETFQVVTGVLGPRGVEERVIDLAPSVRGDGATLCGVHREPGYDAARPAYWYARVLERPTKRWSKRDCETAGRCSPAQDRMIRERAWSSPIWRLP
jgi:hypothetical protein